LSHIICHHFEVIFGLNITFTVISSLFNILQVSFRILTYEFISQLKLNHLLIILQVDTILLQKICPSLLFQDKSFIVDQEVVQFGLHVSISQYQTRELSRFFKLISDFFRQVQELLVIVLVHQSVIKQTLGSNIQELVFTVSDTTRRLGKLGSKI